jgi:predicted glycosyltransferase
LNTLLVYVNNLFGVGHFQRCAWILRALENRHPDLNTVLVFGDWPYSSFDGLRQTSKVRLPGLTLQKADDTVGLEPEPIEPGRSMEDVLDERQELISAAVRDLEINAVMLEYFPFSRQFLAPEVDHLLAEVSRTSSPRVLSSVRDLATIDPGFDRRVAEEFASRRCSHILVHADPVFARLEDTFAFATSFREKVRYTGYVIDSRLLAQRNTTRKKVIAVSVGGGRDGGPLIEMLLDALGMLGHRALPDYEIRVFPGLFYPSKLLPFLRESVQALRNHNIHLCAFSEYRSTLSECSVSISMCGYNTAFELVASRVPNIWFFPRGRTEQLERTDRLQRCGLARRITGSRELAEMLGELSGSPLTVGEPKVQMDLGGAERTADILHSLVSDGKLPGTSSRGPELLPL